MHTRVLPASSPIAGLRAPRWLPRRSSSRPTRWGQASGAALLPQRLPAPGRPGRQAGPGPRGGASRLGSSGCRSPKEPPSQTEASAGLPPAPGPTPSSHLARAGPASGSPAPASRPRPYLPDPVQGVHEALGLHPHRSALPLHQLRHYRPRRRSAPGPASPSARGPVAGKGKLPHFRRKGRRDTRRERSRVASERPVRPRDRGPAGSGGRGRGGGPTARGRRRVWRDRSRPRPPGVIRSRLVHDANGLLRLGCGPRRPAAGRLETERMAWLPQVSTQQCWLTKGPTLTALPGVAIALGILGPERFEMAP